ncbi:MAG: peptidase [Brevundimonas sp.]|nr:MAG: peptidase [Brevundimonas sp.]
MTDTTANAALSGNVLFYGQPEALSMEAHGGLGVDSVASPYGFVSGTNIVPLTVTEFAPAALSYPVIFVGDKKLPVAVMGLKDGDNLFVSEAGEFRADAYIPAYVRRYPFVFANDDAQQRMILCIDRAAPFIKAGGETPLFVDGQPSPYTQQAMEFCNNFEQERLRTESFVKLMTDHDLFETRETNFTPRNPDGSAGQPQKIAEFFAISEEKLKSLSAKKLAELRDNGALGQIYAHLVSMLGWDKLIALTFQAAAAKPDAAKVN